MRWSKVRQLTEASFADSVRGRVTVHVANADPRGTSRADTCKMSWMTVDRKVLARLDRHERRLTIYRHDDSRVVSFLTDPFTGDSLTPQHTDSVMDLSDACWTYLHSSIADSLSSRDHFVESLAILSAKVGKQRLRRLANQPLHPLSHEILRFRLAAEAHAIQ